MMAMTTWYALSGREYGEAPELEGVKIDSTQAYMCQHLF